MKQNNNKKYSVKKSSGGQSKELLQTLQKLITQKAGSVSYFFVEERIDNIHSHKEKDLETVEKKSVLHVNLTAQAIDGKSPTDLVTMFETTKWDLGANYFVVN
jgi:hypothetical protein